MMGWLNYTLMILGFILVFTFFLLPKVPSEPVKTYSVPDSTMQFIAKCIYEGKAAAIMQGHELACLDIQKNPPVKGAV